MAIRTGSINRGIRNALRARTRVAAVIALPSVIIGTFAVLVQMAVSRREQIRELEARVRTLIELCEAGAFGTGGFGCDKPAAEEGFTIDTLEAAGAIVFACIASIYPILNARRRHPSGLWPQVQDDRAVGGHATVA